MEDIGTALSFTWVPSTAGLDCSFVERPVTIELHANDGTADYVVDSITIILDCYPG